jgi:hypothetical protein
MHRLIDIDARSRPLPGHENSRLDGMTMATPTRPGARQPMVPDDWHGGIVADVPA